MAMRHSYLLNSEQKQAIVRAKMDITGSFISHAALLMPHGSYPYRIITGKATDKCFMILDTIITLKLVQIEYTIATKIVYHNFFIISQHSKMIY